MQKIAPEDISKIKLRLSSNESGQNIIFESVFENQLHTSSTDSDYVGLVQGGCG